MNMKLERGKFYNVKGFFNLNNRAKNLLFISSPFLYKKCEYENWLAFCFTPVATSDEGILTGILERMDTPVTL